MHISLLFFIIFLLIVGPEILHLAFAVVVEGVLMVAGVMSLIALLMLSCWVALEAWHVLVRHVGYETAHSIADPATAFTVIVLPFLFWADSLDRFTTTKWLIRSIVRQRRITKSAPTTPQ